MSSILIRCIILFLSPICNKNANIFINLHSQWGFLRVKRKHKNKEKLRIDDTQHNIPHNVHGLNYIVIRRSTRIDILDIR